MLLCTSFRLTFQGHLAQRLLLSNPRCRASMGQCIRVHCQQYSNIHLGNDRWHARMMHLYLGVDA